MAEPTLIREISTAESKLVDQLVSKAFGYQAPHQFFEDFPVWASDRAKRFGIFKDAKLISHVGVRITQFGVDRVGIIGAVATDALHRGQGQSSALLTHVIEFAQTQGLDWLVLWGSEHDFYRKFGFELVGIQTRIKVNDFLTQQTPSAARYKIQTGYQPKIFDLLQKRAKPNEIQLADTDRAWFEKHDTVQWMWIEDPFAFIGFERGMDLPHFVHEWGGNRITLTSILQQVVRRDPSAEILLHPLQMATLGVDLEVAHFNERLCLAKPLKGQKEWPDEFWISGLNAS